MDSLRKKLRELQDQLSKSMKQGGLGGEGSVKAGMVLPNIKSMPKPGNTSVAGKVGMPGIKQNSKKNPVKSAEQTQNKDIKDMKMKEAQAELSSKKPQMVVKFEKNGQWSMVKADDDIPWPLGKPKEIDGIPLDPPKPKEETKKSNYGPKKMNLYNEADNARRKQTRTSEVVENIGRNKGVRQYTSSKMGTSTQQATRQAAKDKAKSKKNPVKVMTGDQIPQELRDKYETRGKSKN